MNGPRGGIKVLRPVRETPLISASVFETLFMTHLGDVLDISPVPLQAFCDEILGPLEAPDTYRRAAERFREYTRDYDFFCPAYECIALAPLFLSLRNTGKSGTRLLFIAHSAGAYAMEWALMRPLLVPGDVIVAPSLCAKKTILFLCPELSPFVNVINHPVNLLPEPRADARRETGNIRIVTLGRIDPSKLFHRQIEAVDILRKRGIKNIKMHIAGPLEDPQTGELTIYARSLRAKIKRLKLEDSVFLEGLIDGDREKSNFLSGARLSVNLSNSIEESFPKASVEPLGLGIPVIACYWNGFVETVGNCGKLIPLTEIVEGFLDVPPEHIADAVEELLAHPVPPERCIRRAKMFLPSAAKEKYLAVLSKAVKHHPHHELTGAVAGEYDGMVTDTEGLIGKIACLKPFTWKEMMDFHLDYSKKVRAVWRGHSIKKVSNEEILRTLVLLSLYTPLAYFYAGRNHEKWTTAVGTADTAGTAEAGADSRVDLLRRIAGAVGSPSIVSSKIAYIYVLSKNNTAALLAKSLELLENQGLPLRTKNYYRSEVDARFGNYKKAFERYEKENRKESMTCYDSQCLRQIAAICRKWEKPEAALPWLRAWLEKYPDEPDSGSVRMAYAYNLLYSGEEDETDMDAILGTVGELLGDMPCVKELERAILLSRWGNGND